MDAMGSKNLGSYVSRKWSVFEDTKTQQYDKYGISFPYEENTRRSCGMDRFRFSIWNTDVFAMNLLYTTWNSEF